MAGSNTYITGDINNFINNTNSFQSVNINSTNTSIINSTINGNVTISGNYTTVGLTDDASDSLSFKNAVNNIKCNLNIDGTNSKVDIEATTNISGNVISNIADPVNDNDIVTKKYIDSKIDSLSKTLGTYIPQVYENTTITSNISPEYSVTLETVAPVKNNSTNYFNSYERILYSTTISGTTDISGYTDITGSRPWPTDLSGNTDITTYSQAITFPTTDSYGIYARSVIVQDRNTKKLVENFYSGNLNIDMYDNDSQDVSDSTKYQVIWGKFYSILASEPLITTVSTFLPVSDLFYMRGGSKIFILPHQVSYGTGTPQIAIDTASNKLYTLPTGQIDLTNKTIEVSGGVSSQPGELKGMIFHQTENVIYSLKDTTPSVSLWKHDINNYSSGSFAFITNYGYAVRSKLCISNNNNYMYMTNEDTTSATAVYYDQQANNTLMNYVTRLNLTDNTYQGLAGDLTNITAICIDSVNFDNNQEILYVADSSNGNIWKLTVAIDGAGSVTSTSKEHIAITTSPYTPQCMTIDPNRQILYITQGQGIMRIDLINGQKDGNGRIIATTLAGAASSGSQDGKITDNPPPSFHSPKGITINLDDPEYPKGILYVSDYNGIRKIILQD
tara:strand:+ start:518 stop:2368 length:1851 start_codon:yes stop_codon:yes gene_type:complete